MMQMVGVIATAVVAAVVAAGVVIGMRSVPDLRRYLKIRHM
ncbi:hypothetical protein ABZV91_03600 [Nocardia sp. NPDC004568]